MLYILWNHCGTHLLNSLSCKMQAVLQMQASAEASAEASLGADPTSSLSRIQIRDAGNQERNQARNQERNQECLGHERGSRREGRAEGEGEGEGGEGERAAAWKKAAVDVEASIDTVQHCLTCVLSLLTQALSASYEFREQFVQMHGFHVVALSFSRLPKSLKPRILDCSVVDYVFALGRALGQDRWVCGWRCVSGGVC